MKKYAVLMTLCLLAAALVITWGLREPVPGDIGTRGRIALLLAQDSGTYMMKLKSGAQDAAADRNAELSVYVSQSMLPAQVLSGDYLAVILTADTGIDLHAARAALGDRLLIMIGGDGGAYSIQEDGVGDGTLAAEALLSLSPSRIVLLDDGAAAGRLEGALAALHGTDCPVLPFSPDAPEAAWRQIAVRKPDALLALSPAMTLHAMEAKRTGAIDPALLLSGFAQGDEAATLLEEGLTAVTVPMPYAIGYRAVEAVFTKQGALVPGKALTLQSLYDGENVSLAFPLLQ